MSGNIYRTVGCLSRTISELEFYNLTFIPFHTIKKTISIMRTQNNRFPDFLKHLNSSNTLLLLSSSKEAVGSSAIIIFDFLTHALAIATRCCSPLDNNPVVV